jgi:flagellar export protein FliJ
MKSVLLQQMLAMARSQEDRAAGVLRAALAQLQRATALQQQLEDFGSDYRQAALDAQRSGGRIGFAMDALAFGQRLHGTAAEQALAIVGHTTGRDRAQRVLAQLQLRRQGLEKLLEVALRAEQTRRDRRAQATLDDVVGARWVRTMGMENAVD